ncbi:glutathionylspermidine synthase family protein [Paenibacillus sp.]|uniref:glutathionylspermidine synthase family protein n=1 Tax=Paenibacillus sp. TaxID=58172 RepID=UPI0028122E9A|nr:glutathionylspermidine synthase family protein [Paenibacillus sp.]
MTNEAYALKRERLYGPLRASGAFPWETIEGEEYALADPVVISPRLRREIAEASERLGRVYAKVAGVVRESDDALLRQLGLPEATFAAVRLPMLSAAATVVGRFDFAETPDGVKMLEWNSDTPTSVVEAFRVNGDVCRALGRIDPNEGMASSIAGAFRAAVDAYRETGYRIDPDRIAFAALDWHEEDAGTTRYLLETAGIGGRFVPLSSLRVYRDRLCALEEDGETHTPIDLLYRLHALEKLAEERDEDGYPTGAHALDLIGRRRLALLNPPSAFIAQTKALQALIWSLHEQRTFFSREEHEAIREYMLPTYMDNVFHGSAPYVRKPIFGREGGAVELFDADGVSEERDGESLYWDQPAVYQQRVELPRVRVRTLRGETEGRLLWGAFLIGGRPSAIVARIGGRITGNAAYFAPVALQQ